METFFAGYNGQASSLTKIMVNDPVKPADAPGCRLGRISTAKRDFSNTIQYSHERLWYLLRGDEIQTL